MNLNQYHQYHQCSFFIRLHLCAILQFVSSSFEKNLPLFAHKIMKSLYKISDIFPILKKSPALTVKQTILSLDSLNSYKWHSHINNIYQYHFHLLYL